MKILQGLPSNNQPRALIIFYVFHVLTEFSVVAYDISYRNNITGLHKLENDDFNVSHAINFFKDVMRNISDYLGDKETIKIIPPKCLRIQCRIICSNGRQSEIANDISFAISKFDESSSCEIIDELYLYNYKFFDDVVPVGFLSAYTNKIKLIYLGISNITTIENGAFGGGIFNRIILEDLRLNIIDKELLANVSGYLKGISIMQHNTPLKCVYPNFLDYVIFQIEYLKLQIGIECVRNVTALDPILGSLVHADFSYNNFSDQLLEDTFLKLTMVETLVLSNSNILYLPNYIFQGLKYLELLDISNNKLKTLSKIIFGIHDISVNLRIFAHSNIWHCDCQLQKEMNQIFVYHNSKYDLFCTSPERYENWMVFDDRLCENFELEESSPGYITSTTMEVVTTVSQTTPKSTTDRHVYVPTLSTAATVHPNEIVTLECFLANDAFNSDINKQNIKWPQLEFFPTVYGALTVKISVEQTNSARSFGLFWFSKTTKEYYMMELLPDEYGLGCYFTMPLQTIVTNLVPNVAYTFCLVDDQQTTVSPFSCKSVHIGSNLDTYYDSWLSGGTRAQGISLMVLGVIVFMFLGIIFIFLVLRRKPIWVKGSKRIVKPKYSSGEVVVLPKGHAAKDLQRKEKMLQKNRHRFSSFIPRRNSMESLASSDSYINPNLYEVIPAYVTFDNIPHSNAPSQPGFGMFNNGNWQTDRSSVRYAQITPRTKRISSDPLPDLPTD